MSYNPQPIAILDPQTEEPVPVAPTLSTGDPGYVPDYSSWSPEVAAGLREMYDRTYGPNRETEAERNARLSRPVSEAPLPWWWESSGLTQADILPGWYGKPATPTPSWTENLTARFERGVNRLGSIVGGGVGAAVGAGAGAAGREAGKALGIDKTTIIVGAVVIGALLFLRR